MFKVNKHSYHYRDAADFSLNIETGPVLMSLKDMKDQRFSLAAIKMHTKM